MPQYRGPYPYLVGADQVRNTPAYTDELAQLLDVPLPKQTYYASAGADFPVSVGWSPVSTLPRLDFNATAPDSAPGGTRLLCLLGLKVAARNKGTGGGENLRVAPAILTDQVSYSDPPAPSSPFTQRYASIEAPPTSTYGSIADTWHVELSGLCSIQAMYTSSGVSSISYSRLSLVPLRWII